MDFRAHYMTRLWYVKPPCRLWHDHIRLYRVPSDFGVLHKYTPSPCLISIKCYKCCQHPKSIPVISWLMFVCGFLSHSRIFHSHWDITITGEDFDLCLTLMAIEQWGFLSVPHLLWHRASVYNGHLWGPGTLMFSSGAVITCFNDLDLLPLGF